MLTDHNRVASRQEALQPHIVEIIDHHKDEGMYPSTAARNVSMVSILP